ncbi:MAG: LamG-like jellyroll fold domain-containing protein [Chloroflexota bacterium]
MQAGAPPEEAVLGFGSALVEDAQGRQRIARMRLNGKQIKIIIPKRWLAKAEFPITVDPVIGPPELVEQLQAAAIEPSIIWNGTEYLAVWSEYGDIYGQRIATNGDLIGDAILVSGADGTQNEPDVVWNSFQNEYLVIWNDHRYGWASNGIWARRIDPNGVPLLSEFELLPPSDEVSLPAIATANNGTSLLVWADKRVGAYDVYGQYLASDGTPTGAELTIDNDFSYAQLQPDVAYDPQANTFLVVWSDRRDGDGVFDLVSQQLDTQGNLGPNGNVELIGHTDDMRYPSVASNGAGQFLVAAQREVSGSNYELQGVRVAASDGSKINEFGIVTGSGKRQYVSISQTSNNGYRVVWRNYGEIESQRVDINGTVVGGLTQLNTTTSGTQHLPALAHDGTQSLVVWVDPGQAGPTVITGRLIDDADTLTSDEFFVSPYFTKREWPSVTHHSGQDEFMVVWQQAGGHPGSDIYAGRIDSQGQPLGEALNLTDLTSQQTRPDVAAGQTEYLVVWQDERNQNPDIYGQRLDLTGQPVGGPVLVTLAEGQQLNPTVVYNSNNDEYLVAWQDEDGISPGIYVQRIGTDGALIGSALNVTDGVANSEVWVDLAYNSDQNSYLVVWEDNRPGTTGRDVYGQMVDATAALSGPAIQISEAAAASHQYQPQVSYNSSDQTFLVVWYDYRTGSWDIYGQFLDNTGALVGANEIIATRSEHQQYPIISSGASGQTDEFLVIWQDKRNGNWDIYGQRVAEGAPLLDESDTATDETNPTINLMIEEGGADTRYPAVAYSPTANVYLAVWTNLSDGGIYSRRYTGDSLGIPIASFTTDVTHGLAPVTVTFTDTSQGTIATRTWDFGDGQPPLVVTDDAPITYLFDTPNIYNVTLTVENPSGSHQVTQQIVAGSLDFGLLGHWSLDEDSGTRYDSTTNGNDLAALDIVPASSGKVGQAADLVPGGAKHLETSGPLSLSDAVTVVGWVKASSFLDGRAFASQYEHSGGRAFRLITKDGHLRWLVSETGTSNASLEGTINLATDQWVQVAAVFDGAHQTMATYVDGQLDTTGTTGFGTMYATSAKFMLGGNDNGSGSSSGRFDGQMDEWRVYNRALSQIEIEQLYSTTLPTAAFTATPTSGEAPLSVDFSDSSTDADSYLWDFGDGTTSTETNPSHTYQTAGVYEAQLTATNSSGDQTSPTQMINVTSPNSCIQLDLSQVTFESYGSGQDFGTAVVVTDPAYPAGTVQISGNAWKKISLPLNVTANTILAFDFMSTVQGEVHGVGLDEDDNIFNQPRVYQLYGTQTFNGGIGTYRDYDGSAPGWKHYEIPVGVDITGPMNYLIFSNDHDVTNPDAESFYANIAICDADPSTIGLKGHWTLDDTGWQDQSGLNNHLSNNNGVTVAPGKLDQAGEFERDNSQYLSIDDATQTGLDITGSLTLVGWAQLESTNPSQAQMMVSKYQWGTPNSRAYRFGVNPSSDTLQFYVSDDGQVNSDKRLDSNTALQHNQWYHVAAVFDGTQQTMTLYLDGAQDATRTVTYSTIQNSTAPFMLGANMEGTNVVQHFDGLLDEWRVYDRALSQAEVQALRLATAGDRTWRQVSLTPQPSAQEAYAMAYDPIEDEVILYGGNSEGSPYGQDSWEYAQASWLETTGLSNPQATYGAALSFNPANNKFLLFGGSKVDDTVVGETWEYNNLNSSNSWALMLAANPPARTYATMATDTTNNAVYLFGGNNGATYYNDVWTYTGGAWSLVSPTGTAPAARTLSAMAYDPDNQRLLLFGGRDATGVILADLWALDLTTTPAPTWSQIDDGTDPTDPPARMAHSLVYDEERDTLVLIGGVADDAETLLADTWHFGSSGWSQATPSVAVPAGAYHQAVYTNHKIVLFINGEVWNYE